MVDLSVYPPEIARPAIDIDPWFKPVFERGRGAVFTDTGFVRAILDDRDQWSELARAQFTGASSGTNFYTTTLVLSELVRQIAKHSNIDESRRRLCFERCTSIIIDSNQIVVCSPPQELTYDAYRQFISLRNAFPTIDLCDVVTLLVLEYARHRRVFGFDRRHLGSFGALVEPER